MACVDGERIVSITRTSSTVTATSGEAVVGM
jgi:hypothetical protein